MPVTRLITKKRREKEEKEESRILSRKQVVDGIIGRSISLQSYHDYCLLTIVNPSSKNKVLEEYDKEKEKEEKEISD